ncbi:MAG: hypothetical protein ACI8QZ_001385 [Chlamydiales bacterium]|jgi:hypothetical protein
MEQIASPESKLSSVEHGAVSFRVLAITFAGLGVVLGGVAVVSALAPVGADIELLDALVRSLTPALNCAICLMLFSFLSRFSTLFCTTAALIREMREVI